MPRVTLVPRCPCLQGQVGWVWDDGTGLCRSHKGRSKTAGKPRRPDICSETWLRNMLRDFNMVHHGAHVC